MMKAGRNRTGKQFPGRFRDHKWSLVLSRERSEWLTALASDSLSQR